MANLRVLKIMLMGRRPVLSIIHARAILYKGMDFLVAQYSYDHRYQPRLFPNLPHKTILQSVIFSKKEF